jgi:hypothetical protein
LTKCRLATGKRAERPGNASSGVGILDFAELHMRAILT